jgi:hypothetical protein
MSNNHAKDDELFTDYALQLFSAFLDEDQSTVAELMSSYELDKQEQLSFLPGILYGCMIHMGLFMSTIADQNDISVKEAFKMYALSYNSETRIHLQNVAGLHPAFAEQVLQEQVRKLDKNS